MHPPPSIRGGGAWRGSPEAKKALGLLMLSSAQQTFQRARLIRGVELGIEPAASMSCGGRCAIGNGSRPAERLEDEDGLDGLSSLVELDAHRAVVRGVSHSGGHELAVGLGQRAVGVADHLGGGSDALRVEAGHAESQIFLYLIYVIVYI